MRRLLFVIAVILLVIWFVNVLFFAVGELLHLLLLFAVVFFVLGRFKKKRLRAREEDNR